MWLVFHVTFAPCVVFLASFAFLPFLSLAGGFLTLWATGVADGRTVAIAAGPVPTAFVAVPVVSAAAPAEERLVAMVQLQARLPNGVAIELGGIDVRHVGAVIEALGRLRCSVSTKR